MGWEYRSRQHVFGLPLIHVTWGVDPFTGRARVARGVVAVGPIALGVVAIGPIAVGILAAGQLAAGIIFSVGQIAAAFWALGQVAIGGAWALGEIAFARIADGGAVFDEGWTRLPLAAAWLFTAVGLALVWWRRGRPILRLVGTPRSIAFTPPGSALVRGRIVALKTIQGPVSHRPVIAYELRRARGGRSAQPERICEDFFVEDGTGRARVLAADARLVLDQVRVREAIESKVIAHEVGGKASGPSLAQPLGTTFERSLLPGDEVVVWGHATRQLGAGPTQVQLAMHASAAGPVLVTNRDLDEMWAEAQFGLWLAAPLVLAALIALL